MLILNFREEPQNSAYIPYINGWVIHQHFASDGFNCLQFKGNVVGVAP